MTLYFVSDIYIYSVNCRSSLNLLFPFVSGYLCSSTSVLCVLLSFDIESMLQYVNIFLYISWFSVLVIQAEKIVANVLRIVFQETSTQL